MGMKRWAVRFDRAHSDAAAKDAISDIASALNLTRLTAALLYHRGCKTPEMARRFVRMEAEYLHDPFLLADMEKGAMRVAEAIGSREFIMVYGDYDADGVTATTLLYRYLSERGANVDYFIPDRFRDGYGMNLRTVEEMKARGVSLIVTVDNGISANEPIARANELGMTVVVTDHHEPHGELPEAYAIINPHRTDDSYPFKELAGVGVAFKMACALEFLLSSQRDRENGEALKRVCLAGLDLVAFGSVADVMPLKGENRLMVSMGLHEMIHHPRPGIKSLLTQSGTKTRLTASTVSFTLAPRVNAAGRLGSAMRAVELLLTEDRMEADRLAIELCDCNKERQQEENGIFESAVERMEELDMRNEPVLVLDSDNWHPGVTGIAASRLSERFGKVALLITYDGDVGKGSARSVAGVNLMQLLAGCEDLMIQYGGHEMAAGLTIRRECVPQFRARMCHMAALLYPQGFPETVVEVDCTADLHEVTHEQVSQLAFLEPCGTENPQPLFLIRNVTIAQITPVGGGRHTKLNVVQDDLSLTAMYFGANPAGLGYLPGDRVHLVAQMDLNEWNGYITPQLLVRDMDHAEETVEGFAKDEAILSRLTDTENPPAEIGEELLAYLPQRADYVKVYQYLRYVGREHPAILQLRALGRSMFDDKRGRVLCRLILRVFAQTDLIRMEEISSGLSDKGTGRDATFQISVPKKSEGVDLAASPLYQHLQYLRKMTACKDGQ